MKPIYRNIHSRFKLNGISFSHDELKEVAYSLIKEGEPFEKEIGDFLLDWLDGNPTLHAHTSGSTGKPKPIRLQKRHMVNSALATGEFFGLQPGDSALLCLPATYIAGKMILVRAMVLGLELDCVVPSSSPLEGICKTYDFCAMVPLQLENSLDVLGLIKILIVGGSPLSREVQAKAHARARLPMGEIQRAQAQGQARVPMGEVQRAQAQARARLPAGEVQKTQLQAQADTSHNTPKIANFSTAIFESYGMTETVTHIALKEINVGFGTAVEQGQEAVKTQTPPQNFKTLPNVTLSIDKRGCLVIDAPKISEGPIITNDVVDLISETEFEWLGRYDNVINSGGVKLIPEQIEAKLAATISPRFFVFGLPDKKLGQKLTLFVEGKVEEQKLFQDIKLLKVLNKFEVPKEIHAVPEFQQTESGKIKRLETVKAIHP